ncbi:MAG TPA: short-chain fatty acyl-CoA regulator family protein [Polyangiaceae bacterium LLY-WYZ-15_(1-7)]|nr:short-chain fatty acyl-CoA regulator family protein [Polyangiaceae bacterium LLY-WYZ-15_(1-7)]HJL03301.1 short-chain fatty acyl-CoA regulator family protein [Polyangiaceae bacterium LLY-WYZ-15_(1-7)]HJL10680.1 short-chain fatty acyl-CoA regulator family protein [Polyangiaceae bacterium LLY-WYZ-15_(1-7)]HJL25807.1 short-chain fatty acyl-CoA regulator family protein [Polyangiaceae bacterium LLY-WYZ-15_(1-7)]HJL31795.1 short-chain fatty acyl-CoA regulator family protein [Polyangiaceae bacterium
MPGAIDNNAAMGQRLRELRLQRGLQQGEVARRLDISPAYLSLIEKGKRTVQLPILFNALELYGVSMEAFMASLGQGRVDDNLAQLLDEPLLRSLDLSEEDLQGLSAEPKIVTTITALFNLYKNTRQQLDNVMQSIAARERGESDEALRFDYHPFDEVTDFLEQHRNFFGSLEERADAFRAAAGLDDRVTAKELAAALESELDVKVAQSDEVGGSVIRRWEEGSRTLTVSGRIFEQRLKFQLAHTIGLQLFEQEALHEPILAGYGAQYEETPALLKIHLANYFAGALLLPYGRFFEEVQRTRYDVELLAQLFESSYETVAHRMCNLGDPKRRGVPMHFLRVDVAGNISKRYSGDGIRFPHHDGSCPKMAAHLAFLMPNVITKQYSQFPDGTTYFEFAKVVSEPRHGSLARGTVYSIGLGCHADDAKHLAYADDVPFVDPQKMAVPVGTTCRFCERMDCNMRSSPSYKFAFRVDERVKKDNFFSPLLHEDELAKKKKKRKR